MQHLNQSDTTPHIDSLNHPMADEISRCLAAKPDGTHPWILVEDPENLHAAYRHGLTCKAIVSTEADALPQDLLENISKQNTPVFTLKSRTAKKLFANTRLPKHFALCARPQAPTLAACASQRDLLVLDGISITGNLGAICRTAAAFGIGNIVLLRAKVDPYDRRIIRASRGHVFHCPMILADQGALLTHCQQHGITPTAMTAQAQDDVSVLATHPSPIALMMGEEKTGLDPSLAQHATRKVQIPMATGVESLNVSVATGIALYARHLAKTP